MAGYKEPGLQDRLGAAAKARADALARLKAKPPVDPEILAERAAKAREREAALAQRSAERAEALQRAKAEKAAERAAKAQRIKPPKPQLTEAERKAARDARYAARKARQASRPGKGK